MYLSKTSYGQREYSIHFLTKLQSWPEQGAQHLCLSLERLLIRELQVGKERQQCKLAESIEESEAIAMINPKIVNENQNSQNTRKIHKRSKYNRIRRAREKD